jgi:ribulose-5-phosphate 4-epimerase/fuculose-1-phosphate aldolase
VTPPGQRVGQHGLVALDWHSGNRSLLVDHRLGGALVSLTLSTTAAEIYRALIEGTAFGTRKIVEAFESAGLPVEEVITARGLLRNPLVIQTYADVLRRPLSVIGSEQGPALGSAIHAAVAAGAYPDVPAAAEAMGRVNRNAYRPGRAAADRYDDLYEIYSALHDHFGVERPEITPSSDTATHAHLYRHMPHVNGVAHTHSGYAAAWAARGQEIPCVLTTMADEFGGSIPIGPFAPIGNEEIGREIVRTLSAHRSPAVLMQNHGVFTVGGDARAAVKAAVMCEDVARTVHLAASLGDPLPIPADAIDRLHDRY